jgi:transposase-like protein
LPYSEERKEAVLAKMMPPHNRTVADLALEEGISTATLYNWRRDAREQGRLLPRDSNEPEGWSARDKFNAVLETASLSESELAEYCRKRGLYPEQIGRWRRACEGANDRADAAEREHREAVKAEKARSRELERELKRKDAALAETAALLTLRKKAQAIWGDGEDG